MNISEKILKQMETPEYKAIMDKWIEDYVEKTKLKIKKTNEMMSNTEYFEWLDRFTINIKEFASDDWLYNQDEISDYDKEKVKDLGMFYFGIKDYAIENSIIPTDCEFGNYYNIKLNELGFEIGIILGQGTIFFCKRVQLDDNNKFINLNNVIDFYRKEKPKQLTKKYKNT